MEKTFGFRGKNYVMYQEHGAAFRVNGRKVAEFVLQERTDDGRVFIAHLHVPAARRGQQVIDHAINYLAA